MRIDFCGNCDFYADRECRRFPPTQKVFTVNLDVGHVATATVYPDVYDDTPCCGEFKPIHNPKVGPARPPSAIMEKA